jgi:trehalose utilization protein
MTHSPRVLVWNEGRHEKTNPLVTQVYPNGIHHAIAELLRERGFLVDTATLDDPEHGLTTERLAQTDVLLWWAHVAHHEVQDEIVSRVHRRVLEGMGLIPLHSAHFSKIFQKLMGTTCNLSWREANERERIWVVEPGHPIAAGLGPYFEIDHEEMYGEPFDIPAPESLVFVSWFRGGEVFRSGCCYRRGRGKIFYFRPGHETYPTYYHPQVQQVIYNAVVWASPTEGPPMQFGNRSTSLEPLG